MSFLSETLRSPRRTSPPPRRGAIFIVALGVIVILSGLLLVFASEMRTEAIAAANRLSAAKADAVAMGAEEWVLAQIDLNANDPIAIEEVYAEGIPVGEGYFWIIRPDVERTDVWAYGIQDEAGKLNINAATYDQLMYLPGMTSEIADSIIEWRGSSSSGGIGNTYYSSLPEPYNVKGFNFETVEELLLVKDVTQELLFGRDHNRDGVLSEAELQAPFNGPSMTTGGIEDDGRGWASYMTVYSIQNATAGGGGGGGGGANRPTIGRINVATAPKVVLQTLGLSESDADALISTRSTLTSSSSTTWIASAIGQQKAQSISQYTTNSSSQYSADIVAVSPDGRAFKRVRIVVDARSTPATIVYRKDLTEYGWPLDPAIRQSLRNGEGLTNYVSTTGTHTGL